MKLKNIAKTQLAISIEKEAYKPILLSQWLRFKKGKTPFDNVNYPISLSQLETMLYNYNLSGYHISDNSIAELQSKLHDNILSWSDLFFEASLTNKELFYLIKIMSIIIAEENIINLPKVDFGNYDCSVIQTFNSSKGISYPNTLDVRFEETGLTVDKHEDLLFHCEVYKDVTSIIINYINGKVDTDILLKAELKFFKNYVKLLKNSSNFKKPLVYKKIKLPQEILAKLPDECFGAISEYLSQQASFMKKEIESAKPTEVLLKSAREKKGAI